MLSSIDTLVSQLFFNILDNNDSEKNQRSSGKSI